MKNGIFAHVAVEFSIPKFIPAVKTQKTCTPGWVAITTLVMSLLQYSRGGGGGGGGGGVMYLKISL